ncbi:hypothetical protein TNIN_497491 [Trichonephila inaurata madagascariensis]|uniref:Uncharacterized protein n=1 Tax=Trichonephila inaurata madagascariensis TaxID=2747483 RepID=A0A8X6YB94_9ARAC|nr:hypothetical protein TNIN_497491 [Trichonephila inaurata madagascariensis]
MHSVRKKKLIQNRYKALKKFIYFRSGYGPGQSDQWYCSSSENERKSLFKSYKINPGYKNTETGFIKAMKLNIGYRGVLKYHSYHAGGIVDFDLFPDVRWNVRRCSGKKLAGEHAQMIREMLVDDNDAILKSEEERYPSWICVLQLT